MRFFDSHCHVQDPEFAGEYEAVFQRARAAGVEAFLLPASTLDDAQDALELALNEDCFLGIGQHPHDSKDWTADSPRRLRELYYEAGERAEKLGRLNPVRAIGEIGLDYYYDLSPRDVQRACLREQIELASELNLPVIIHERDAFQDCYQILKEAVEDGLLAGPAGVIHCFSGSKETAVLYHKLGFCLGFDGPITFKNAKKFAGIVRAIPLSAMLIETDSPYLSPDGFRGEQNEPAHVPLVALKLAEYLDLSLAEVAAATYANAEKLFAYRGGN
ncbi:MAG: TatD family hydrolase [Eubacteriales bacterium]|nr:TatD family hydrolase [Eubacteriales bacterium]